MHRSTSRLAALLATALATAAALPAAIVFTQDFSASSDLADYLGSGANRFQHLANADSSRFSVSGGRLLIAREASAGSDYATLRFAAEGADANLAGSIATGFTLTADLSVFSYTTDAGVIFSLSAGYLQYGNQQGATARIDGRAANSTDLYLTATGGSGAGNTWTSAATTITWVVNHTGADYSYTTPAGGTKSLASGFYDLWIGDNAAGSRLDVAFSVNPEGFNSLQFDIPGWSAGDAILALDNLVVSSLAPVPEPASAATLLGVAALALAATRRR
jgi:hypothetical protein